jgi:DNA-binding transcriptional ArsR family regulator
VSTDQAALTALADPTRRAIVEALADGPLPVGRLAGRLPVTRPAVSQHLKVLKAAGLVLERAEGTRRLYRLDPRGLADVRAWIDRFWDRALAAFKDAAEASPTSKDTAGSSAEATEEQP